MKIGEEVHRLAETSSTNDAAFALGESGAPEGTVVLAAGQTSGRGRQGRRWFSVPGKSLTFSVILRPSRPQRQWPELPLVAAGGVAEAVAAEGVGGVTLKSPNDVMARGRKIAGVLLENRIPGTTPLVVAGIGVNVNLEREDFPEELREGATSLAILLGEERECDTVLSRVCDSLEELYRFWLARGLAPVRSRLEANGVRFRGFPEPH